MLGSKSSSLNHCSIVSVEICKFFAKSSKYDWSVLEYSCTLPMNVLSESTKEGTTMLTTNTNKPIAKTKITISDKIRFALVGSFVFPSTFSSKVITG